MTKRRAALTLLLIASTLLLLLTATVARAQMGRSGHVTPGFASDYEVDGAVRNAEGHSQRARLLSGCGPTADRDNCGVRQFGSGVTLAPENAVRVQARPVSVATSDALGLGVRSVAIPTRDPFRLGAGPTVISSGQTFGMNSRPVRIATDEPFRIGTRAVPVATCATRLHDHVGCVICLRPEKEMIRVNAQRDIAAMQHARSVVSSPRRDGADHESPREPVGLPELAEKIELSVASRPDATSPQPTSVLAGRLVDSAPETLGLFGSGSKLRFSHVAPPVHASVRGVGVASTTPASRFYHRGPA